MAKPEKATPEELEALKNDIPTLINVLLAKGTGLVPLNRAQVRTETLCLLHACCSGASSETGFKLKALLPFSQSKFETGCFQARVSSHRPQHGL